MTIAEYILSKAILPTHMNSAEIRDLVAKEIRRRSIFTARCAERAFLEPMRQACADYADGKIRFEEFAGKLRGELSKLDYDPETGGWEDDPNNDGEPLSELENLYSEKRLRLIAETQRERAYYAGMARSETAGTLYSFPAHRLYRYKEARTDSKGRSMERNWAERWQQAADWVNWEGVAENGELVALKGSPIWQALGDGAGGYTDTLGDAMPPFAFNSGMGWDIVRRDECEALGLDPDSAAAQSVTLEPDDDEFADVARRFGKDFMDSLYENLDEGII